MKSTPLWLWLNLLSLDAPLVAVVWQDFLARCYPSTLLPAGRLILFLSVWAIYLADRFIDSRNSQPTPRTPRHLFYRQHRRFAAGLLVTVLTADLFVAAFWLRSAVRNYGLAVGALALFYMAIFPFRRTRRMAWKQPLAAAVFACGVFVVSWANTAQPWRFLAGPALAFAALCLGNMVLIEKTEDSSPVGPKALCAWGWTSRAIVLALLAAARYSRWYTAVGLDTAGLSALEYCTPLVPRHARGVLADLLLFTPLLLR